MPRWIRVSFYCVASVILIALLAGRLFLAAPVFSDVRRSVVQDILSREIGQPLFIETDVRAFVGTTIHVTVSDVTIPSEEFEDLNLAELKLLAFDVDTLALFGGSFDLDNLKIDGLNVELLVREDGTTSWSEPTGAVSPDNHADREALQFENGIIAFLSDRNADVSSVVVSFEDRGNGFEFLYALEYLALEQMMDRDGMSVSSRGTVNDLPLELEGNYPAGEPFTTSATMGGVSVRFDGKGIPRSEGGGFAGALTLDTGEIGDLLDVLKLNRTIEGTGELSARLVRQGARLGVEDLRTVVGLRNGSEFVLEGNADDLLGSLDFDLTTSGRLFPEGRPPGKATKLKQLELTEYRANIVSEAGNIEFREVHLETNLIEGDLREIGPISVDQVRRTETGGLALEGVQAQAGPRDAPYMTARGGINDLFQLKELEFTGTLNAPASLILDGFQNDTVQAFGGIVAEFEVSDATGQLSLSKLEARSDNTDLWTMRASAEAKSFSSVDDVDFEVDLDIPDGAAFLSALQLDAVDIGPVEVVAAVGGRNEGIETRLSLAVRESRIETTLNTSVGPEGQPIVRGTVRSPLLNMRDLENTVKSAAQLVSMDPAGGSSGSTSGKPAEREVQPLVLDLDYAGPEPDQAPTGNDTRVVQPLVLEQPETSSDVVKTELDERGRTIQPLVLDHQPADGELTDLFDPEEIGRDLDLEIGIEIERIVGQAGVSKLSSALVSKGGRADLGPLEFSYGGGYFKVGAALDFVDAPQLVRVTGATSGWDLGEILDSVGAGIKARGKLNARFDLTGRHDSPSGFLNSMSGAATISMTDGAIATSLLELAGLGLFPWLFSNELQQGYTSIACVVAPLQVNSGKVSSNAIVAETRRVQLVAAGTIDWVRDSISLRGEPRPLGRPLNRSPWPFEVSGRLSNPDFRLRHNSILQSIFSGSGTVRFPEGRTPCKPDALQAQ